MRRATSTYLVAERAGNNVALAHLVDFSGDSFFQLLQTSPSRPTSALTKRRCSCLLYVRSYLYPFFISIAVGVLRPVSKYQSPLRVFSEIFIRVHKIQDSDLKKKFSIELLKYSKMMLTRYICGSTSSYLGIKGPIFASSLTMYYYKFTPKFQKSFKIFFPIRKYCNSFITCGHKGSVSI